MVVRATVSQLVNNSSAITDNLAEIKANLILEIHKRRDDGVIIRGNADLLEKLINNADSITEANAIMALGNNYKRTGFHFDLRVEEPETSTIRYLEKDDNLSFISTTTSEEDREPLNHKLIIGENLYALLNLLVSHKGQIDVIYIDPPYGKDSMGQSAKVNYGNKLYRDDLLSMLHWRLTKARELLADDGVIFCSIDDRNQAYVKCLFDDVFGESNFITQFSWEKTPHMWRGKGNVLDNCEYILAYAKQLRDDGGLKELLIERANSALEDSPMLNNANAPRTLTFPPGSTKFNIADGTYQQTTNKNHQLISPVVVKDGLNENEFKLRLRSKWSQETLDEQLAKGTTLLVKTTGFAIRTEYYEGKTSFVKPKKIIFTSPNYPDLTKDAWGNPVGINENGSQELEDILSEKLFINPKPVSLIRYLLSLVGNQGLDSELTILDFFAGSGTTGQAVLELNKLDGGQRTFILCQNDEPSKDDKGKDLARDIATDITYERLKRIMTGQGSDGSSNFKWLNNHIPFGDNLEVLKIEGISNNSAEPGHTPFDVIDETLYGQPKLSVANKIEWVCTNFRQTQVDPETSEHYLQRVSELRQAAGIDEES